MSRRGNWGVAIPFKPVEMTEQQLKEMLFKAYNAGYRKAVCDWPRLGLPNFEEWFADQFTESKQQAAEQTEDLGEIAREACRSAIAYDEAIQCCANDPQKMATYCSATEATLDALYEDWISLARKAMGQETDQ